MGGWTIQEWVFLIGVVALTITAAYTDLRYFRIYNKLTIPAFFLGWVYQGMFHGLPGLWDGFLGFAIGFGMFFLMFAVGAAGGGDTKLMGALSVWLGMKLTLWTVVLTIVFVAIASILMLAWSAMTRGLRKTREDLSQAARPADGKWQRSQTESLRRIGGLMAYAEPMALATWVILALDATVLPFGQLGHHAPPAVVQHAAPVETSPN